jgi:hypothetical protein
MKEFMILLLNFAVSVFIEITKISVCLYLGVAMFLPVPQMELHKILSTTLALYVLYTVISERNDNK